MQLQVGNHEVDQQGDADNLVTTESRFDTSRQSCQFDMSNFSRQNLDDFDNFDDTNGSTLPPSKTTSLRKREVILSKISIYIVFVFIFCHSLRIIPNVYEMITTYMRKVSKACYEYSFL